MSALSDPEAFTEAFETRARRVDTPCGAGAMAWRIWGAEDSGLAPVVLGHGAQGAWSHWIRNIDALAENRMVIAVDLPGHGDSAMPASEDHAGITRALSEGLRRVVGERPVDLVGFSFGGTCFAYLAAHYPDAARRLVLVGTGGLDTPMGHVEMRRLKGLEGEARRLAIIDNLLALMIHDRARADDLAIHLQVLNGRRAQLASAADLVLPDKLLDILPKVPVQIDSIWGAFDQPHPAPAVQEEVLRRFDPELEFVSIADAGHWVMYEQPEAFNRALVDMLDRPLRRKG